MTLDEAIVSRMTAFAPLVALVADRVHPGRLPQNSAYPAVTYLQISGAPEIAMVADPGLGARVYQFSVWDDSFAAMRAALAEVKACWERYQGTIGGLVIQDAYILNELVLWDEASLTWQGTLDVQFWPEG